MNMERSSLIVAVAYAALFLSHPFGANASDYLANVSVFETMVSEANASGHFSGGDFFYGTLSSSEMMCSEAASCDMSNPSVSSAKPKKEVRTVVFSTHLHCKNCVAKVQENIAFEKGVKDLKVSLDTQTITVIFDPQKTSEEKLAAAIRKLGYHAEAVKE